MTGFKTHLNQKFEKNGKTITQFFSILLETKKPIIRIGEINKHADKQFKAVEKRLADNRLNNANAVGFCQDVCSKVKAGKSI